MDNQLWTWTACDIVDGLERKDISQLEVLDGLEERCFEVNPLINALPTFCFDRARDSVGKFLATLPKAKPLMGLPVPIKDSYAVEGIRTTFGSVAFKDFVPSHSDLVTLTIENSGGIIYAKSNTPEFEAGASTFNEVFGITRNPWNTSKSVAGSSGGAAASIASGMAFIAQGSDFACSVRYPASFCGVVGLRPTPGLIPQGPNRFPYQTLSVIGPLARNVKDIGLAMDSMVGFDVHDPLTRPSKKNGYRTAASQLIKPKSVGFSLDMGGLATISSEVRRVVMSAVAKIERAGVELVLSCPNMSEAENAFRPLRAAQFAALWSHVLEKNRDLLKPEVVWNIEQGLVLTSSDIADAENKRRRVRKNLLNFLDKNEFLILPTAPVAANAAEDRFVKEIDGTKMRDYLDWLILGYAISLTGCPVISIPCGFSNEQMPIGIQLVGRPHCEEKLLQVAAWLESVFNKQITMPINPISG